jgi:hypothetical protein
MLLGAFSELITMWVILSCGVILEEGLLGGVVFNILIK